MVDLLLQAPTAASWAGRLQNEPGGLHAPHLIDIECAGVIRRFVAAGLASAARGRAALQDLADFPLRRHPHNFLLPRIWTLRDNLTAYDAVYVALAEALDAVLFTRDRRLAAAPGVGARVALVGIAEPENP